MEVLFKTMAASDFLFTAAKAKCSTMHVWLIGHILSTIDSPSQLLTSSVALH